MDILEPFIDCKDAMSLKVDPGLFWTRWGAVDVQARQETRDSYTRFTVSKTSDNKLLLKADTGKYLCLWGPDRHLVAALDTPNNWCEFTVHDVGSGLIALQGTEGLFLSRWGENELRAACRGINKFCKFLPMYGSLVDPKFEILDVKLDPLPDAKVPETVDETTFVNKGSYPIEQTVELTYSRKEIQTTSWKQAWMFGGSLKYTCGIEGIGSDEFSVHISVGGEKGGSSSAETTTKFTRSYTVTAQSNKKTTVKLTTKRLKDAVITFHATIKRTESDGTSRTFTEDGTWKGVAYYGADIYKIEEPIPQEGNLQMQSLIL